MKGGEGGKNEKKKKKEGERGEKNKKKARQRRCRVRSRGRLGREGKRERSAGFLGSALADRFLDSLALRKQPWSGLSSSHFPFPPPFPSNEHTQKFGKKLGCWQRTGKVFGIGVGGGVRKAKGAWTRFPVEQRKGFLFDGMVT